MAGDAPAPASGAPPIDYNAIIQQIMQGGSGITGPAAPATPAVNTNLPIPSLLGEALGGGVSPLYPMSEAQQTQAGNAALLNFGIGMLQNSSGPVRHSLGQAIASGLLGAQGSLAGVREGQAQTLDVQNKQQEMHLKLLEAAMPFLRMQQAAGMPNPLDSSAKAPGGGIGATGAPIGGPDPAAALPKDQALAAIVQRESGGRNIPTQIMGSDGKPASTASGPYQMLDSTWLEAAGLAGIKNPPARAMDASRADQDAAASALYDKYGVAPWKKSAPAPATTPTKTATAPPATTTPPVPVARPAAAPTAPAGTIQGTPDTGGTQVGGPGALPGVIRPPGPLVPGDVKAMIGGMTGAGASPTTLAPGGGTAAPTAPTIAQAAPPTVTPPAQPTPQQPTQVDQPPPIGGPLTIEQYRALHPSVIDPSTYTVTPNPKALAEAEAERQTAAQNLQQARQAGDNAAANKALNAATEASSKIATLQQQADTDTAKMRLDAQAKAETLTQQGYNDAMTRQQQAALKAQELAQTAAENEKNRQADIRKAELAAGYTSAQKQADADIDIAKNDITDRAAEAQKASRIIPVLQQMQGQFGNLPTGFVGGLLAKYDTTGDITGMLARMGVVDPSKATAAQLLIAARNYLSIETKPAATGSLRVAEMDKLQSFTPGQLDTPQAQQEMIGRLIAYQKRIQDERTFAGNYFGRTDPTTGKRIYDNRGLETAMNAPVQYNENGVVTGGGLGPVVPEPPPLSRPDAEHQAYLNYIHRNVAPGMPYQSWEPKTNPDGSTARDARGQPVPQRVTKIQGYQ